MIEILIRDHVPEWADELDFSTLWEEPTEFVYLVLYHGDGPWSGPDHVTDLFQRSDPGRLLGNPGSFLATHARGQTTPLRCHNR